VTGTGTETEIVIGTGSENEIETGIGSVRESETGIALGSGLQAAAGGITQTPLVAAAAFRM